MLFQVPEYKYHIEPKGKFSVIDFFEFADSDKQDQYRLPFREMIFAIPKLSRPIISLIPESEVIFSNSIPRMNDNAAQNSETNIQQPEHSQSKRSNLEIIEYFWHREFYCVKVRVNTHNFDPQNCKITAMNKFYLDIAFDENVRLNNSSPIRMISKYDELYKNIICNFEFAEQFRTKPEIANGDSSGSWIDYNKTYIKLGISNDGLIRILRSDFEKLNINPESIDPRTIKLWESGKEKSIYVFGESDSRFDSQDYIEFWGSRNYTSTHRVINGNNEEYNNYLNRYTDTSFYFITWGGSNGKRAEIISSYTNSVADTLSYYSEYKHIENNTMFQVMNNDEFKNQTPGWEKNKSWVWNWIMEGTYSFSFFAPGVINHKTSRVFFKMISTASNASSNSHIVKLSLNGEKLDSQIVNRYEQILLSGSLNSTLLKEGVNTITIKNFANGTSPNQIALDWYEYEYPRSIKLFNDSLYFQIDPDIEKRIRIIKIMDVLNSDYVIYNVRPDLKSIKMFYKIGTSIVFTDTVQGSDSYVIISPSKIGSPKFLYAKNFINLREIKKQADYIGITHPVFLSASKTYVNEISKLYNVTTELVNILDIFDQFGFGYPQPEAIKRYLQFSVQNWQQPKPAYVCLIGDANYDYHKYLYKYAGVKGGGNFVPSYGYPVSDNWLVTFDTNNPFPQMKLGRLPINSPSELEYYLSKVLNNKNQVYDFWNKQYLFFSGGIRPEEFKPLKSVNDSIINKYITSSSIVGNYFHFYKTLSPTTDFGPYSTEQINKAISGGGIFISYIGHSGTATWDNSISEVDQLKNSKNRNPLITDFGCSTNKFAEPDIVSFGERFVLYSSGQALGYVGNSSLGFTSTSTIAPQYFYESIFSDSLHEVGSAHLKSKIKMFEKHGSSITNKIFSLTNTVIGDPIVQLKIPLIPNLFISQSDIICDQSDLVTTLDSTPVKINFYNLGISIRDSLKIRLEHVYNKTVINTKLIKIRLPDYKDSLTFWLKIKDLSGAHTINITLDAENAINEIYEFDNHAAVVFNVFSSDLRDLLANQMENGSIKSFIFLNPVTKHKDSLNIIMQYSAQADFKQYTESSVRLQDYYTRIKYLTFNNNHRYWFRTKIDKEGSLFSAAKSFYSFCPSKYLLIDTLSFAIQKLNSITIKSNKLYLSTDSVKLSVISAGWVAGSNCIIAKDSKNLLSNTYFAGMGIVVFDPVTMEIDTSQWYNMFGLPENVQQLTNLINSIQPNKVVIMGVSDDAANNLTGELKNAIKTLGSTKIDQLKFRGSWAIIGRKGAAPGEVIEEVKGPYDGSIYLDSVFVFQNSSGSLITKNIGPAARWKNIRLSYEKPSDSQVSILLSGIRKDSSNDSLNVIEVSDTIYNIDAINSNNYKYLKLEARLKAASDGNSPSISMLGVDYISVPELGTNYQVVSVSRDSVVQGDSLNLGFYVYNVGESPADSFNVKVELVKPDNSVKLLMDSLVARIDTMSRKHYSILYHTNYNDGTGNMKFRIIMDPENKITELYKDNNIYETSFYVKPDTTPTSVTSASLDVTFDGVSITEGDYVSSKPEVRFVLSYPVWFPVHDTTALQIYMDNKQIFYSQLDLFSDTINRKAVFKYLPELENGEHHLRVFGKNIIGKIENSPGYQVYFQVQNELKLLNVYNYPNPFKNNTSFTFTLTQVPDDLQIKIYTVAGRLIKDIDATSFGIHSGFNTIPWDGRDEDGNFAANGVYLYKVIVRKGEQTEDIIQKLAVLR